jgi:hypothetical protein
MKNETIEKTASTDKTRYYQKMFVAAAIWNWFAALAVLFSGKTPEGADKTLANRDALNRQLLATLITSFGLGYFWLSRDTSKNHDIVKLGILGKTAVFFIALINVLRGKASPVTLGAAVVDLLFVFLFVDFLRNLKKD